MRESRDRSAAVRVALAGEAGLGMDGVRGILESTRDLHLVIGRDLATLLRLAGPVHVIVIAGATRIGGYRDAAVMAAGVPFILVHADGRLEIYERRVLREAAPEDLLAEIRRVTALPPVTVGRPQYERTT